MLTAVEGFIKSMMWIQLRVPFHCIKWNNHRCWPKPVKQTKNLQETSSVKSRRCTKWQLKTLVCFK